MDATRLTLLERAAQGGQDAWRELDQLYRPFIDRWFRIQGVHDADDLTQEIMTALVHEIPKFEHNRRTGAFRAWLRTVCLHRLLNHRRGRKPEAAVGGTEFMEQMQNVADAGTSENDWDREHDQAVLRHLFARLTDEFDSKTLEAFRRLALLEQAAPEVATELGMSVGAVYVAKSRVLRRLREEAEGLLDGEFTR